jgi:hypothetical protein
MEHIDTEKPILGIWKELPKVSSVPCGKINRTRNTFTMYFFAGQKYPQSVWKLLLQV